MGKPRNVFEEEWTDTGTVVQGRGSSPRNVVDNDVDVRDILHMLRMMEINRRFRDKKRKNPQGKSRQERLQGLFGSRK